jgi:Fe-S cluster biogenesis protein NfuA/nitrite reductase/ring-hydroxylating ferredoxin subunit
VTGRDDLRAMGDRVEALLAEIDALADAATRRKAEELVRLLVALYGAGLARLLEVIAQSPDGDPLLERLAADHLVGALLIVHGLHPIETEARVRGALDRVRPYLASHGGNVELVSVQNGVVHLRLEGTCHGCPSSQVTMKLAVERAIEEAAPEIDRIEVEGLAEAAPALHQIERPNGQWLELDSRPDLSPGELTILDLEPGRTLLARLGEGLYAYQDGCPACGCPLAGASLAGTLLTCPSCRRRYDLRHAGREPDGAFHLEPVPLLDAGETIKIALPAAQPCRS